MSSTILGLGALLLVAGASVVWFRAAQAVRLPRNRTPFVAAWLGGAVLGAAALTQGPNWIGGSAAALALLAGSFFCLLVAISRQVVAPNAVRVGAELPDFSAPNADGQPFALASTRGSPLLLKFFRGHW